MLGHVWNHELSSSVPIVGQIHTMFPIAGFLLVWWSPPMDVNHGFKTTHLNTSMLTLKFHPCVWQFNQLVEFEIENALETNASFIMFYPLCIPTIPPVLLKKTTCFIAMFPPLHGTSWWFPTTPGRNWRENPHHIRLHSYCPYGYICIIYIYNYIYMY